MSEKTLYVGELNVDCKFKPILRIWVEEKNNKKSFVSLFLVEKNKGQKLYEIPDLNHDIFALYRLAKYVENFCLHEINCEILSKFYNFFSRSYDQNCDLKTEDHKNIMKLKIPKEIQRELFFLYFNSLINEKVLIKEFEFLAKDSISFFKLNSQSVSKKQVIRFILKKSALINPFNLRYLVDLVSLYHDSNGNIDNENWNELVMETYKKNPLRWGFSLKNSEKFMKLSLERLVLC